MPTRKNSKISPHRLSFSPTVTGIFWLLIFIVAWFSIAGRVTRWQAWIFLGAFSVYVSILVWCLSKVNPELVRERNLPADKAEAWDRVVMQIYSMMFLILLAVSAMDAGRYIWSKVSFGIQLAGWILLVVASALIWHVMMMNTFLSSWARIQDDREQVVIQEGMYRNIRHPMYFAIIIAFLGIPLTLASWWASIPGVVIVALFIYRTFREDQMLIEGLDGYAEYTKIVKYRLLPRIWC